VELGQGVNGVGGWVAGRSPAGAGQAGPGWRAEAVGERIARRIGFFEITHDLVGDLFRAKNAGVTEVLLLASQLGMLCISYLSQNVHLLVQ
jgi:hypothetical protein